ncbi:GIY-YIG nuclease family protein [Paenibacillus wulumuqiensis]|uniref:GIY-YIG nuclease family protein n=1 Tax=Paenibacillus wulumuqiensis TaxID=1567107 RepID=UPI000619B1EC|nr:GIY-YIG nuclease family protein [Paenibacillus wulumuqiensis]
MDRRKELQEQYKEMPIQAGIYEVRNIPEQKVWVTSTPNLRTINGSLFSLELGSFIHRELQADWTRLGKDQFEVNVLEVLKPLENPYERMKDKLQEKEEEWTERLRSEGVHLYLPLQKNTSV